jgi:hypothetical protein
MKRLAVLLLLSVLAVGVCSCSCGQDCQVRPTSMTPGRCSHWGLTKDQYANKAVWMEPALPPQGPDP